MGNSLNQKNIMRTSPLLAAVILATGIEGKLGFGGCPDIKVMPNIDTERFAGRWYVIKRDDAHNPMYQSRCGAFEVHHRDGATMDIHMQGHNPDPTKNKANGVDAVISDCGNMDEGTCKVSNPNWKMAPSFTFNILDTDYENYFVYHFCFPMAGLTHFEFTAVGSRTKEMPQGELYNRANKAITDQMPDYDLNTYGDYSPNIQEDFCTYKWKWG